MYAVAWSWTGHEMDLDAKVRASFSERGVSSLWYDPRLSISEMLEFWRGKHTFPAQ